MVGVPWPNSVNSTTSALSTAKLKARRTRGSSNGGARLFMIAASQDAVGTLSTRRPGRADSGFTCSNGRSHTTSISPACRAATLTLISGMMRSSTPASFGMSASKYSGLRAITRRSPGV